MVWEDNVMTIENCSRPGIQDKHPRSTIAVGVSRNPDYDGDKNPQMMPLHMGSAAVGLESVEAMSGDNLREYNTQFAEVSMLLALLHAFHGPAERQILAEKSSQS